jgi:hypothetical protein
MEFGVGIISFGDPVAHLLAFRLTFGVFIFAVALINRNPVNLEQLFFLLSIATIAEKLLIVVMPSLIYILPNYDGGITFSEDGARDVFGGVHSFGGNRSVSGVLLLSGFVYCRDIVMSLFKKSIILFGSLICMSGTALILAAIYLIFLFVSKMRRNQFIILKVVWLNLIAAFLAVMLWLFSGSDYESAKFDRFSLYYVNFIADYKLEQIQDYLDVVDMKGFFFGMGVSSFLNTSDEISNYGGRYGDFIALDSFSRYGLLGAGFFLILITTLTSRAIRISVLVILVGTFHYHVLFAGPGQLLTALLLADGLNRKSKNFANNPEGGLK